MCDFCVGDVVCFYDVFIGVSDGGCFGGIVCGSGGFGFGEGFLKFSDVSVD